MNQFLNKIDDYLSGALAADELAAFEKELASNTTLAEQVQIHQLERETALLFLEQDMKANIQKWRTEGVTDTSETKQEAKVVALGEQNPQRTIGIRRILSIAASVLVLVGAGIAFWANQNYTNDSLAMEYYLPADAQGNRSGANLNDATFNTGLTAFFVDKDYVKAKEVFSKITNDEAQYVEAQYYLGHISTQLGEYTAAISYFDEVLAADNLPAFLNRDKINWNQLLAKLGTGQMDTKFKEQLDTLIQTGKAPFNQKAKALHQQLNSPLRKIVF